MTAPPREHPDHRRGTAYGFLAYALWGTFPLYFTALRPAGAWEILAHRIVWTLVVCAGVLAARRNLAWVRRFAASRRLVGGISLAAFFIAANWVIYVLAVLTGRTYEAALGYFLNPILTVALGVVVLRERLRPPQWVAVAIGLSASVYLAVAGGVLPWISLSLAVSFGLYGLIKKRVGASMQAMHSLAAETAILTPPALVILGILTAHGSTTFARHGGVHAALLLLAGVITAIPLLLFAAAARRIPLVLVGLMQFITPVLQLLASVLLLGEHVSPQLWVGFGIVWVALVVLTVDAVVAARRGRRATSTTGSTDTTGTLRAALDDPHETDPCP